MEDSDGNWNLEVEGEIKLEPVAVVVDGNSERCWTRKEGLVG